jgi:hypothetical protein
MRQKPLYVFSFAVPGDEANDGKCMAEVMQPWLISSFLRAQHASLLAQPFEHEFCRLAQNEEPLFLEELVLVSPLSVRNFDDLAQVKNLKAIVFRQGCSYRQMLSSILDGLGIRTR